MFNLFKKLNVLNNQIVRSQGEMIFSVKVPQGTILGPILY